MKIQYFDVVEEPPRVQSDVGAAQDGVGDLLLGRQQGSKECILYSKLGSVLSGSIPYVSR